MPVFNVLFTLSLVSVNIFPVLISKILTPFVSIPRTTPISFLVSLVCKNNPGLISLLLVRDILDLVLIIGVLINESYGAFISAANFSLLNSKSCLSSILLSNKGFTVSLALKDSSTKSS